MDAISLLKTDHKTVEKLFKQYEKLGDNASVSKARVVESIIEDLAVHAAIEEQFFYPAARKDVPETTSEVLESLEEHHVVKWLLSELDGMEPSDERFDAKVTVLIELVRHHVEEEEGEFFPKVRKALGRKQLGQLGETMAEAKKTAPTRPHPKAPDTPPGNLVVGLPTAIVDRVATAGKRAVRGTAKRAKRAEATGSSSSGRFSTRRREMTVQTHPPGPGATNERMTDSFADARPQGGGVGHSVSYGPSGRIPPARAGS